MQFVDIDADFGRGMVMFVISFQELVLEPKIKGLIKSMHTHNSPKHAQRPGRKPSKYFTRN